MLTPHERSELQRRLKEDDIERKSQEAWDVLMRVGNNRIEQGPYLEGIDDHIGGNLALRDLVEDIAPNYFGPNIELREMLKGTLTPVGYIKAANALYWEGRSTNERTQAGTNQTIATTADGSGATVNDGPGPREADHRRRAAGRRKDQRRSNNGGRRRNDRRSTT
jgi:hypothetical protein